ncbi:MAG: response regulator [Lentisphaerae bacterium]|nr:response regulator [Lentisphaerota bacterium]
MAAPGGMMRILIVDDDADLIDGIKDFLVTQGHDVDCTCDAETGVAMVARTQYDFVLIDYKMPDKNGAWFMQNAKLSNGTKSILITAFVNRSVIDEMFRLGVSGYLIKPFDTDELIRHLAFHSENTQYKSIAM